MTVYASKYDENHAKVLAFIQEHQKKYSTRCTVRMIAEGCGIAFETARTHRGALVNEGQVVLLPYSVKKQPVRPLLSPRPMEVLNLLAKGRTTKQIARDMNISERTVMAHIMKMRKVFMAETRAHIVHLAHERGLL